MKTWLSRVCVALWLLAAKWSAAAQSLDDDVDDADVTNKKNTDNLDMLDEFPNQLPIHIDFSDVLMVVLIIAVCYVFGKIWKGCSYLIIILAALFFYLTRG